MTQTPIASKYRYSPITPLNSAPGLKVVLSYTFTRSEAKQSEFELPTTEFGGVTLTQNQTEERDRTVSRVMASCVPSRMA